MCSLQCLLFESISAIATPGTDVAQPIEDASSADLAATVEATPAPLDSAAKVPFSVTHALLPSVGVLCAYG